MRKQRGITLIALVITIIVLLILAGVTVATLTGDNGLLQKTTTAKEENEKAKELELIKLAVGAAKIDGEGTITTENLNSELRNSFNDNSITVSEISEGWSYIGYKIDKDGEVEKWIPKEYQQVEYIESTGTQYIDTGKTTNYNYKIEIDCFVPYTVSNSTGWLFGARIRTNESPWSKNGIAIATNSQGIRYDFGNKTNNSYIPQSDSRNIIVIENTGGYCNGIKLIDFTDAVFTDSVTSGNMLLCSLLDTGSIPGKREGMIGKIYSCNIWKNEQLIRNFIPCYSTTTVTDVNGKQCSVGTAGLYDTVEGKFYTNQGTGTFGYETEDGTYVAPSPTNN